MDIVKELLLEQVKEKGIMKMILDYKEEMETADNKKILLKELKNNYIYITEYNLSDVFHLKYTNNEYEIIKKYYFINNNNHLVIKYKNLFKDNKKDVIINHCFNYGYFINEIGKYREELYQEVRKLFN